MTREEEIKQAVENNLDVSIYTPKDGELLKETFYIGAKWADKNPQFPWISVKEDLPCNHEELIQRDYTLEVLAINDCNSFVVIRMWKFDDKWQWGIDDLSITHWMRLPELPKE